jgi:hypothetical protein
MSDARYLGNDDRLLLDHYINMYNETNRNIDLLYREQEHTRELITALVENAQERWYMERFSTINTLNERFNQGRNRVGLSNVNTQTNRNNTTTRNRTPFVQPIIEIENILPRELRRYLGEFNFPMNTWPRNFEDNVPVVASTRQIRDATRNSVYSQVNNPLNTSCPISLEPFDTNTEVTELVGCHHVFSRDGLTSWLRTNVRCPVCRRDIRTPLTEPELTQNIEHDDDEHDDEDEDNNNNNDNNDNENHNNNVEEREQQNTTERTIPERATSNLDLTTLTESLLRSLLISDTTLGRNRNNSTNSTSIYMSPSPLYDASNNTFIYTGYYRNDLPRR